MNLRIVNISTVNTILTILKSVIFMSLWVLHRFTKIDNQPKDWKVRDSFIHFHSKLCWNVSLRDMKIRLFVSKVIRSWTSDSSSIKDTIEEDMCFLFEYAFIDHRDKSLIRADSICIKCSSQTSKTLPKMFLQTRIGIEQCRSLIVSLIFSNCDRPSRCRGVQSALWTYGLESIHNGHGSMHAYISCIAFIRVMHTYAGGSCAHEHHAHASW